MTETLNYDPTDPDAPEFTEDEQDSIEVAEKLGQEENELLAGKYRNAEDLEEAYLELQKKLGSDDDDEVEDTTLDEDEVEYDEATHSQIESNTMELGSSREAGFNKGIELVYELPVKQETIDNIRKKAEELDLESLDYKTLLDQAPEATKEMFGKSTKAKAQFIADNWKTIYDLLPKNLSSKVSKAASAAV